jgi:hypothetical protein
MAQIYSWKLVLQIIVNKLEMSGDVMQMHGQWISRLNLKQSKSSGKRSIFGPCNYLELWVIITQSLTSILPEKYLNGKETSNLYFSYHLKMKNMNKLANYSS